MLVRPAKNNHYVSRRPDYLNALPRPRPAATISGDGDDAQAMPNIGQHGPALVGPAGRYGLAVVLE